MSGTPSEFFEISGRRIGPGYPTYIVAELSANHNGDYEEAVRLVHAAKEAGADCVKLQTYTADTITIDCDKEYFQLNSGTAWDGQTLHALYKTAFTPWEWQPKLKALCDELGMHCFSSPFDDSSVDFLEAMGVDAYKVASFEVVDHLLLRKIARTGKPVVMSSGTCTLSEIESAVRCLREAGCRDLLLLKCTSAYPTPPDEVHLRAIPHMRDTFGTFVGLSDHTLGTAVPVSAVAVGACFIEKHFCMSRAAGGPDSGFSLEPAEFKAMVEAVRVAERAMGKIKYADGSEQNKSRLLRRSLFIVEDVRRGELLTSRNVRSIRPAHGLHTSCYHTSLGRPAAADVERGEPLTHALIGSDVPVLLTREATAAVPGAEAEGKGKQITAARRSDGAALARLQLQPMAAAEFQPRSVLLTVEALAGETQEVQEAVIVACCLEAEQPRQCCQTASPWLQDTLILAGFMRNPLLQKQLGCKDAVFSRP